MDKKPRGPVGWVLLHDLGYTPASLSFLESALADQGCRVVVPALPGEGALPDAWRRITASDLVRPVRDATLGLLGEAQEVCLFGHGMGALLAMQMAEELPVKALLLAAPTLRLPDRLALASSLVARFQPYQSHGDARDDLPEGAREKGLSTAGFTVIRDLARRVLSDRDAVTCPVRMLVPGQDQWSDPKAALDLAEALPHAKAIVLPEGRHQCLTGEGGAQLLELARRMSEFAGKERA